MSKKFNVTHEFQPFNAEEISFNVVRRLSTDVLKSKLSLHSLKQPRMHSLPRNQEEKTSMSFFKIKSQRGCSFYSL